MFKRSYQYIGLVCIACCYASCTIPVVTQRAANASPPASYGAEHDSANTASVNWRAYFNDPYLNALIDTALENNQELNITLQEIAIARNEVRARKGEYLPSVGIRAGAGVEKAGRYTNTGALEANTEIVPGRERPEPLPDHGIAAVANWEVDIWRKLRNAKNAAVSRYLATMEGRNFVVTNLVAEVANSYYDLLALDNQLEIVKKNIEIQSSALEIVKAQKQAARVTELAVRRFEAEVAKTKGMQFDIQQRITETENKINFLLARYPQPIPRNSKRFDDLVPASIQAGIPSQLLSNRPDIRRAEHELEASKLDVKVAKAQFYPSLGISAAVGYRAFNPSYFLKTPESMIYSLAGDVAAPLINRNAIKAFYYNANARQLQAAFDYERTILNAYVEVANQLSNISNLQQSYSLKLQQVQALTQSIDISNELFKSARADYMEVLLTQRDALESKFELIETKKQQLNAMVDIYHALGGGWK